MNRRKLVYSLWKGRKGEGWGKGVGNSANLRTLERSRWQSPPSISMKATLPEPWFPYL